MGYFPHDMPRPEPTMDEAGFWAHCAERSLQFQCCGNCGTMRHPPMPMCPRCQSCDTLWKQAPAQAVVYSFTVLRHASHPAVAAQLPYVVGVVEFPALAGVRLVTNITGIAPEDVRIGLPVTLWWDDMGDGLFVPRFRA